jgi:hypothetical protein
MCRKSEPTTVIAVRVPVVERERLAMLAMQRQETMSELARRALAMAMTEGVRHDAT